MKSPIPRVLPLLVVAALLPACADRGPVAQQAPVYSSSGYGNAMHFGVVSSIETVHPSQTTSGGGALLGAVVGAVVGRQLGSGSNARAAGTAVGVLAGAAIGNEIERHRSGAQPVSRVTVRLDQGGSRSFDYARIDDLRVGDRVRIENDQLFRY